MSTLDFEFDFDARVSRLELEWMQAYEANLAARADYYAVVAKPDADLDAIDLARERLKRSQELKNQILSKIDRLEGVTGRRHSC